MSLMIVAAFAAGLFTAWTIGANGAAAPFGPVTSAGAVNVLRGSLVVGVAAFLGAVTQGGAVTGTIRDSLISEITFTPLLATIVLVTASSLILFSIITQYPMPTVFTVVGSVLGAGMAANGTPNIAQLKLIGLFWLIIPFVAIAIGYTTAYALRKYVPDTEQNKKYIRYTLFLLAAYTAYTAGANQAGLAVGPLQNTTEISLISLLLFAGGGMMLGAWMGSPRVIAAVARDYSKMGPRRAIAALLAASSLAQIATLYGVPVSFNEAVISAVIGSGLVEGRAGVSKAKIGWTIIGWISGFAVAFSVAYTAVLIIL